MVLWAVGAVVILATATDVAPGLSLEADFGKFFYAINVVIGFNGNKCVKKDGKEIVLQMIPLGLSHEEANAAFKLAVAIAAVTYGIFLGKCFL